MRLLICNWTRRKVAGIEDYLCSIFPDLLQRGYHLAFISEVDSQVDRPSISLPSGVPDWCIEKLGLSTVLENVRTWQPDLLYCHGALSADIESQLLNIAPAVYFSHNYYGTCVGGYKAHRFPNPQPCNRKLGLSCLANYLPRRCGGLSPITMLSHFRRETARLQRIKLYQAIVTHSEHMRHEYVNHGIPQDRVFGYLNQAQSPVAIDQQSQLVNIGQHLPFAEANSPGSKQLMFLGRMELLKGGQTLIQAATLAQKLLAGSVKVLFAGDGPQRELWQRLSRTASCNGKDLTFSFPGWLSSEQAAAEMSKSHVMVVPSLWPEPFGRVGVEAGLRGLPVAAFKVGGISDWLQDGVNGFLAPGNPPTAEGLATAIVRCLDDRIAPSLQAGARRLASRFSTSMHLDHLENVFNFALARHAA